MKTLISGGTIITEKEKFPVDLLLADGRIAALGNELPAEGAEIIDASGKYILPGGVDAHTHITLDLQANLDTDIFYQGTIPAAAGGTTCIVDHLAFTPEYLPLKEELAMYHKLAKHQAVVDYLFHGLVQDPGEEALEELSSLCAQGCSSVKAYMTYDRRLDDEALFKLLCRTNDLGLLLIVHAEDHETVTDLRAEYKAAGKGDPVWHARSRPASCEAEAITRLLRLAHKAGDAPICIAHLSTALGLTEVKRARAEGQKNIFVETCTQYLTLSEEKYLDPLEGLNYIMSPPLRTKEDIEALWRGLEQGDIQTVASDHCSFTLEDKKKGLHDFIACPGGAPGLEERFAVFFSAGVSSGRISPNTFVQAVSSSPAKLFGIYPNKGSLNPGTDADLVILDPTPQTGRYVLKARNLHGPSDYSAYEGLPIQGRIQAVFLRGIMAVENNIFLGERDQGKFVPGQCQKADNTKGNRYVISA